MWKIIKKIPSFLGKSRKVVSYFKLVTEWLDSIVEPTEKFFQRIEDLHDKDVDK